MPMIPYIHSSLVPIMPYIQKCCADFTHIIYIYIHTIFGVKYGYIHVLDLPHFPSLPAYQFLTYLHLGRTILYKIKFQTMIYGQYTNAHPL